MKKGLIRVFIAGVLFCGAGLVCAADELKDLSADASYEFARINGYDQPAGEEMDSFNVDKKTLANKDFLLKDNPNKLEQKFAFQTKLGRGVTAPFIIITLVRESDIRKIYIQNRRDGYACPANLVVWVSKDKNLWKRIWEDEKASEWTINLPKGEKAKYVRIGFEGYGNLSLNKVRIYGN